MVPGQFQARPPRFSRLLVSKQRPPPIITPAAALCAFHPIQYLRRQKPVVCSGPYLSNVTTLIAVLAAMKAFDSMMPMFSGRHMQERPEAAFLRVVETVVKKLCCIGTLFHLGRARRKMFGALLQAFRSCCDALEVPWPCRAIP